MITHSNDKFSKMNDLWKRGLNFTKNGSDSHIRSKADPTGMKSMLLAKVIKSKDEKATDELEMFGNDMVLVFASRRIYPEYVIRYR